MSPDERLEQKVRLRVQLEEAQQELNHWREAANAKSDLLIQLADWLKNSPERNIYRAGMSIHEGFVVEPIPEKYVTVLNINEILDLANEIRKNINQVRDFEQRLTRLG
jgi:hypothetical protein